MLCAIATVLLGLRLVHKTKASKYATWALVWSGFVWVRNLSTDLYCSLLTPWKLLGIPQLVFLAMSVSYGMGRHASELTHEQIKLALQCFWIQLAFAIWGLGFGKTSVIAFLLELQGPTHIRMRWCLIGIAVINVRCCQAALFRPELTTHLQRSSLAL